LICFLTGGAAAACFYVHYMALLLWILPAPAMYLLLKRDLSGRRRVFLSSAFVIPFFFFSYTIGFTIDVEFPPALMFLIDFALVLIASVAQGIPLVAALFFGTRFQAPEWARGLIIATFWTAGEWLCTVGPLAWPVRGFAVAQWKLTPFLASASLFGMLFVSFITILFSVLIAQAFLAKQRQKVRPLDSGNGGAIPVGRPKHSNAPLAIPGGRPKRSYVPLVAAGVLFFGNLAFGLLYQPPAPVDHANIIMIQHNVPTTAQTMQRFETAALLAENALDVYGGGANPNAPKPDLVIFPESTAQFLPVNRQMKDRLAAMAVENDVEILVGGLYRAPIVQDGDNSTAGGDDSTTLGDDSTDEGGSTTDGGGDLSKPKDEGGTGVRDMGGEGDSDEYILENCVFQIDKSGRLLPEHFVKQQLVPFFENGYVQPFDFFGGTERGVFRTSKGKVGTLICYESLLQESARQTVREGAQLLVVPTNDAYMESPEIKEMHFSQIVFRAIENGRTVAQAATNGITGVSDANGRISSTLPIEEEGVVLAGVDFYDHETLYTKIGNLWLLALFLFSVLVLIVARRKQIPAKDCTLDHRTRNHRTGDQ
jgi:apolipoprotein N-acyltransferase